MMEEKEENKLTFTSNIEKELKIKLNSIIRDEGQVPEFDTREELMQYLNDPKTIVTPDFILRRQVQLRCSKLLQDLKDDVGSPIEIPILSAGGDTKDDDDNPVKRENVSWDSRVIDAIAAKLAKETDPKLAVTINKYEWKTYLTKGNPTARKKIFRLAFAVKMDEETLVKYMLVCNVRPFSARAALDLIVLFCLRSNEKANNNFSWSDAWGMYTQFVNDCKTSEQGQDSKKNEHDPEYSSTFINELNTKAESNDLLPDEKKTDFVKLLVENRHEISLIFEQTAVRKLMQTPKTAEDANSDSSAQVETGKKKKTKAPQAAQKLKKEMPGYSESKLALLREEANILKQLYFSEDANLSYNGGYPTLTSTMRMVLKNTGWDTIGEKVEQVDNVHSERNQKLLEKLKENESKRFEGKDEQIAFLSFYKENYPQEFNMICQDTKLSFNNLKKDFLNEFFSSKYSEKYKQICDTALIKNRPDNWYFQQQIVKNWRELNSDGQRTLQESFYSFMQSYNTPTAKNWKEKFKCASKTKRWHMWTLTDATSYVVTFCKEKCPTDWPKEELDKLKGEYSEKNGLGKKVKQRKGVVPILRQEFSNNYDTYKAALEQFEPTNPKSKEQLKKFLHPIYRKALTNYCNNLMYPLAEDNKQNEAKQQENQEENTIKIRVENILENILIEKMKKRKKKKKDTKKETEKDTKKETEKSSIDCTWIQDLQKIDRLVSKENNAKVPDRFDVLLMTFFLLAAFIERSVDEIEGIKVKSDPWISMKQNYLVPLANEDVSDTKNHFDSIRLTFNTILRMLGYHYLYLPSALDRLLIIALMNDKPAEYLGKVINANFEPNSQYQPYSLDKDETNEYETNEYYEEWLKEQEKSFANEGDIIKEVIENPEIEIELDGTQDDGYTWRICLNDYILVERDGVDIESINKEWIKEDLDKAKAICEGLFRNSKIEVSDLNWDDAFECFLKENGLVLYEAE